MIYESGLISLIIQLITGFLILFGLNIDIPDDKRLLNDLLKLELGVQSIELIFYIWLIGNINQMSNITKYRYYDWMFSTPIMLITLNAFLDQHNYTSIQDYVSKNKSYLGKILLANLAMLVFGLLGEMHILNYNLAIILGWIPFIYVFARIYEKKIKNKTTTTANTRLYWLFLISWSLYGVAAFLPYVPKNIMYNVLDLFSKNLVGLILFYTIWKNSIQ